MRGLNTSLRRFTIRLAACLLAASVVTSATSAMAESGGNDNDRPRGRQHGWNGRYYPAPPVIYDRSEHYYYRGNSGPQGNRVNKRVTSG